MREAIVGFDSAWGDRVPGAAAWATVADGRFETFGPPRTVHFDCVAQIVAEHRINADYVLVAMDQPSLVPNEKGMRPVERVAASLVSGLGGGVQPANRRKALLFGAAAPVWRFLDRLGARQNPPIARTATDGLHLIEVFPALALPALCPGIRQRKRAAFYNPANQQSFLLSDYRLVVDAVRSHADELGFTALSDWAARQAANNAPTKGDQDCLDAAICLLVALQWRRLPRHRMMLVGDLRGYMVTPVSPETRTILMAAAKSRGVPVDADWPQDADHRTHAAAASRPAEITHQGAATSRPRTGPLERRDYPCPVPGCTKVFHGTRGGWDAHVASWRMHPHLAPGRHRRRRTQEAFQERVPPLVTVPRSRGRDATATLLSLAESADCRRSCSRRAARANPRK